MKKASYIISTENKKKIRMLHLVQSFGMGGAEALLWHYIKSLPSHKYEHYVYYFMQSGPHKKRIEELGAHIKAGPTIYSIKNPIMFIKSIIRLFHNLIIFIKKNNIQIIQSHLRHANQLAVITGMLTGVPAFPTIHNTNAFLDKRSKSDIRVYVLRILDFIIYRIAPKIIAISEEVKNIISKRHYASLSRIIVLKNGIVFQKPPFKKSLKPGLINSRENPFKMLSVGRLTHQKGFDTLIKAASELNKKQYNCFHVFIAGEGEDRKKLEGMIEEYGLGQKVKLLGIRHDVYDLMQEADIFVMPSRYEGLSIAMIEAMAMGMPIIAADAPGLNSHIIDHDNGLLFKVNDYKGLSETIYQLSTDPKLLEHISYSAKASFNANYNMEVNIATLEKLISTSLK